MNIQNVFVTAILAILLSSLFCSAQETIDYVNYARYDNPPNASYFIGHTQEREMYVSQIVYTKDFSYHDISTLKVETLKGETTPDTSSNTMFVTYDDEHFIVIGIIFVHDTFGEVDLKLDEPATHPRSIVIGDTITKTGSAKVQLGPIPAILDVSLTVNIIGFETVEVPLGRFENAIKADIKTAVLLAGVELGASNTTEWFHPLAGLIKQFDKESSNTIELSAIDPPIEITDVTRWEIY